MLLDPVLIIYHSVDYISLCVFVLKNILERILEFFHILSCKIIHLVVESVVKTCLVGTVFGTRPEKTTPHRFYLQPVLLLFRFLPLEDNLVLKRRIILLLSP